MKVQITAVLTFITTSCFWAMFIVPENISNHIFGLGCFFGFWLICVLSAWWKD